MKGRALRRYCIGLLKKHGCGLDTYRWTKEDEEKYGDSLGNLDCHIADTVISLRDVAYGLPAEGIDRDDEIRREIFENSRWTALDIVAEFYAIGNEFKPRKKDKYTVVWDNESCTDGYEAGNSIKRAKDSALETLSQWINDFGDGGYKTGLCSRDAWDRMIFECTARVFLTEDAEKCEEPVWEPSARDLKRIGWVLSEDMDDETYGLYAATYGWPER